MVRYTQGKSAFFRAKLALMGEWLEGCEGRREVDLGEWMVLLCAILTPEAVGFLGEIGAKRKPAEGVRRL